MYVNLLGSILWSRHASDSVTLLLLDISRKKRGARLVIDLQANLRKHKEIKLLQLSEMLTSK